LSQEIGLRFLAEADIPTLVAWEKAERPYPWSTQHFLDTLTSQVQQTLIWESQGQIVGFAVLQIIEAEAYVLNIMISPHHRRTGLGVALMEKVISLCRAASAENIFLDVDPLNEGAFGLYKKIGFEPMGRRKNAYPNGEDAILMKRKI
jgi:[ribosomal protein S18]-alanine N-acetyltransferase